MKFRAVPALVSLFVFLLGCIVTANASDDEEILFSLDDDSSSSSSTLASRFPFKLKHQDSYALEAAVILISITIFYQAYFGRKKNEQLAVRYVAELVRSDGAIQKQFADADAQVIVESPDVYKFYVSGRRYCQGALMTFRLASRQDITSLVIQPGQRDVLDIEINMNESAMPQTVLFIGTHSAAKAAVRDNRDIATLAKRVEPTRDRLPSWSTTTTTNNNNPQDAGTNSTATTPAEELVVYAEHTSVFYDVINPVVMDQFFGPGVFPQVAKYFRSFHASSDFRIEGYVSEKTVGAVGKRAVVKLSLTLPPPGNYDVLDKFVMLACLVVDGLGTCKLSPEQIKKGGEARRKAEAAREDVQSQREKRLEERRAAKEAEEKERLAKLPPEQREKEKAKREKILRQRKLKQMVKRM